MSLSKTISKNVNLFTKDEAANSGIVLGLLATIVAVIVSVIVGSQFISIGSDMLTSANDTDGLNALGNLETVFYMIIGLVILLPLVSFAGVVMYMLGGKKG